MNQFLKKQKTFLIRNLYLIFFVDSSPRQQLKKDTNHSLDDCKSKYLIKIVNFMNEPDLIALIFNS